MFTVIKAWYAGDGKSFIEAVCKTGDPKDTEGIANGSICRDMIAKTWSMFDEEAGTWLDQD